MNKPNILFITTDQMRWDCMGCAGNPVIQTPHLDALAAAGTRFCNAFSPDPICVPARATIMTGNYPQVCTGIKANRGGIREGQPLLTATLKAAGYRTYALGKLHFLPYAPPDQPRNIHGFDHVEWTESGRILKEFDPKGERRGVEDYFDYLHDQGWYGYTRAHGIGNNDVRPAASPVPENLYVDTWIADRSMAALDRHRSDYPEQPFFLWMSSPKPHSPYDPPRPYDALYDPRDIPKPFGDMSLLPEMDPGIEQTLHSHACDTLSPEAWQVIRSHYYGNISFFDAQVGRVLAHLEDLGQRENTLIVFTSDHRRFARRLRVRLQKQSHERIGKAAFSCRRTRNSRRRGQRGPGRASGSAPDLRGLCGCVHRPGGTGPKYKTRFRRRRLHPRLVLCLHRGARTTILHDRQREMEIYLQRTRRD